ncbi:hypothetical protein [Pseudoalteromonas aurantia]|uniref:Uncharacterized protein n=1 Tax=Pseudoalteromonas aurantia TaxID=43654 RepID=A0A5S3V5A1_9GAMM|nr:hypothetical protein [Pseudoalteromonas aurantia]TMO66185.1 hypothetical protein CWC19_16805 [Pseudoalteromonas aurantia]
MTTTVVDLVNKLITADTRWSCVLKLSDGNKYVVYCDETGFHKISVIGKAALVTAGHGPLIAEWKEWWAGTANLANKPQSEIDGENVVNLAIVDLERNSVIFDAGAKQILYCTVSDSVKAFASGSGSHHAASYLMQNSCAKGAIGYAAKNDICTGNEVTFACYKSNQNNLNNHISDYNVISNGIINRGKIMALDIQKPNANGVDLNNHPLSEEVKELFTTGKAVASAPVPGISSFKWTKEVDRKLESAMKRVHELRNK